MPLHISEIGVRMAISEAAEPGGSKGPSAPGGDACSPSGGSPGGMTGAQRDALVEDCVRGVLATLKLAERR